MSTDLYRKAAIDKISSPEQLDDVIDIVSLKSWFFIAATFLILTALIIWGFFGSISYKVYGKGIILNSEGSLQIKHHLPGKIKKIMVNKGNYVQSGKIISEIYNYESSQEGEVYQIRAPKTGFVIDTFKREGEFLNVGEALMSIEIKERDFIELVVYSYIAAENGKDIKKGMFVEMEVGSFKKEEYGFLLGRIKSIDLYPSTKEGMFHTIGNENLVSEFSQNGSVVKVEIALIPGGENSHSGYKWSANRNPRIFIQTGTLCKIGVTTKNIKPINLVFPNLKI